MTEDLNKVVEALKQEGIALKNLIDQLSAQKDALSQTLNDVLQANVALKTGTILLERQIAALNQQIAVKDGQIAELSASKSDSKKK